MFEIAVVILLVLLLAGSLPYYGYSRGWGYGPSGVLGLILVVVLILWLAGAFAPRPVVVAPAR